MSVAMQIPVMDATPPSESVGRRFVLGAFWAIFGAVVSRGLTLAGWVLAGRLLGATGFGEINMIQSTQGMFGMLAGAGLGLAATKFVAEFRSVDAAKTGRCIALGTMLAALGGLLAGGLMFVLADEMAATVLHAPQLGVELRIATGLIFFGAVNGMQTGALAGLGEFRTIAWLNILRGVCFVAALLVGIWLGGVLGAVIGLVVTEGVAVVANQLALQRRFPHRWRDGVQREFMRHELVELGKFSALAILASIATSAGIWFSNVVLVTQADGYASLGVFNAAERWRQVLLFLPASVAPILLSMLSNLHGKNDPAAYRKLIGATIRISMAIVIVPAAAIMLLAPWAMGIFGPEYREGSWTLVILAGSALPVVLNTSLGQVLTSRGAMGWRFALDVLLAAMLALTAWLIIPAWRDQGLALASLIAYSAAALALIPPVVRILKKTEPAAPLTQA